MDKVDYDKMFERTLAELEGKPRLLLHVCCAPCLAAALPRLGDKFDVTYWFYDPNIWPESEYDKRLGEVARFLKESGAPGKLIAEKYDRSQYDRAVGDAKGGREHGEKCVRCCRDRVFAAARKAAELGCEWFTTTLTSGPLKSAEMLNAAATEAAELYGVKALPSDFKKKGGNLRTKEACEKYGIYRQKYCGCTPPRTIVVITGGIASGKSTLTRIFGELGAYTMDADKVTRELQAEGTEVNAAIKRAFPNTVRADGTLDRAALKAEVFADKSRLAVLEGIVHPAVKAELLRRAYAADTDVVIQEIPLYYESGCTGADVVVNVEAPVALRRARAVSRDKITEGMFDSIASSQLSDEERRARADVTIRADGDPADLYAQAEELLKKWRERSK